MFDRRLGLLLTGVGAACGYAWFGLMAPAEIEFTRPGPAALPGLDLRPAVSTAHVTLPVDLPKVARRAEAALTQRLAMGLDVADTACNKRPQSSECANARFEGTVSLAGRVDATASGAGVRVRLPLKIDTVQGADKSSFEMTVNFAFKVQAGGGLPIEVSRIDEPSTDGAAGSNARAIRFIETRLRPLALSIQDELRVVLGALPVTAATEAGWNALSQSIDLGGGHWLKAMPEVAGLGDLVTAEGGTALRIPISARLSVEAGERGASPSKRGVVHGQVNTAGGAVIRVATPIVLSTLQPALDGAFVKVGSLETRPDRFGPPVKVDVRKVRIYPSLRQVGVELDIAASRFEGQTFLGKAHLMGRPVLDVENRVVTLADISLAPVPQRDASTPKFAASAPRLANDPFSGKLAAVFRIDVARDVAEALPRTSGMLQRRFDDKLSISARLSGAAPVAFELSKDGGWLLTDLSGTFSLEYAGPGVSPVVAVAAEGPAVASVASGSRKVAMPEIAAAAVTTAAAVAATHAMKAASGGAGPALSAPAFGAPSQAAVAASASSTSSQSASSPGDASAAAAGPVRATGVKQGTVRTLVPKTSTKSAGTRQASAAGKSSWVPFPTNN